MSDDSLKASELRMHNENTGHNSLDYEMKLPLPPQIVINDLVKGKSVPNKNAMTIQEANRRHSVIGNRNKSDEFNEVISHSTMEMPRRSARSGAS